MDAKPQRPRALRIHDENLPPTAITTGKSLHMRTKSVPALSMVHAAGAIKAAVQNRKVLGEANANIYAGPKDDIDVGKVSPAKLIMQEGLKQQSNVAPLARPAVRPLAPKSGFSQNTHVVTVASVLDKPYGPTKGVQVESDAAKKIAPKKSKILKDALPPVDTAKTVSVVEAIEIPATHNHDAAPPKTTTDTTYGVVAAAPKQAEPIISTARVPLVNKSQPTYVDTNDLNSFAVVAPAADQYLLGEVQLPKKSAGITPRNVLIGTFAHDNGTLTCNVISPSMDQFSDLAYDDDDDGSATGLSLGQPGETTSGLTLIFAPQYTDKVKAELAAAKAITEATRPTEDIEDEQWDTSMVAEYSEDIFEYMHELETRMLPNARYMDYQNEIQWNMRGVLLDWVIQVHNRFSLLPETLFLAVNFIDRFLSIKVVSTTKLQLVGATALFLAAKYEEVNCPSMADVLFMGDGAYTADELLRAERFMLNMLRFDLGWPGPLSFLRRISKADDYDLETRTPAKYFLEVTLMDERFVGCTPSFLAAGAHCLARIMLRKGEWSPQHVHYSNYTLSQLRRLVVALTEACRDAAHHHAYVFEKYSDKRYKRASIFVRTEMLRGFSLALDFSTNTATSHPRPPSTVTTPVLPGPGTFPPSLPTTPATTTPAQQSLLASLAF